MTETRRIHGVKIENVLAVECVELTPCESGVQVIAGPNSSGKSSVLHAVELALEYRAAIQKVDNPLRQGTEKGTVTLDLGDVQVTRTFTADGDPRLTITRSESGDVVRQPQTFLDAIRPPDLLDPLNFSSMRPEDRRAIMIRASGLTTALMESNDAIAEAEVRRRDAGRDLRQAKAVLDSCPPVPIDAPPEPVSASELAEELRRAEKARSTQATLRQDIEVRERRLVDSSREIERLEQMLKSAIADREAQKEKLASVRQTYEEASAWPTEKDFAELRMKLTDVDRLNAAHQLRRRRLEAERDVHECASLHEDMERRLATTRACMARLIESASLPLEGLGFDDEDATYRGVRWSSLGTAEQMRVALSLGLAQHPGIPVFVMHRGESLDRASFEAVQAWAVEHDVQILMEVVGGEGHVGAFVLEGGRQAGIEKEQTT